MKRLRLFFAVHLLLVALLPAGDLQSLQRLYQSVTHHFQDHHSRHGISLLGFLKEHLSNPEHDHEHEHNSSEQFSNPLPLSVYVAAEVASLPIRTDFAVPVPKAVPFYRAAEPVAVTAGIWQPPRA